MRGKGKEMEGTSWRVLWSVSGSMEERDWGAGDEIEAEISICGCGGRGDLVESGWEGKVASISQVHSRMY